MMLCSIVEIHRHLEQLVASISRLEYVLCTTFQSLPKPLSSICNVIINWDLMTLERSTFEYLDNVDPKFLQQFMD
jgi:hypothetical protein